jgi:hypothetical protein
MPNRLIMQAPTVRKQYRDQQQTRHQTVNPHPSTSTRVPKQIIVSKILAGGVALHPAQFSRYTLRPSTLLGTAGN